MSDRIAVMRGGRFEQVGTPEEIYEHPATRFTAGFIGQTNLLECKFVRADENGSVLEYAGARFPARKIGFPAREGETVCLSLRTERLRFSAEKTGACALEGTLTDRRYAGGTLRATIRLRDGHEILALCASADRAQGEVGANVWLSWNPEEAPVVPQAEDEA